MNMNKVLGLMIVSLFVTAGAQAQGQRKKAPMTKSFSRPYGMAGCGLGTYVFQENDHTQILAATTNGSFGTQTFGITSGTSNCVSGPNVAVAEKLDQFLVNNSSQVAEDLARGNGEALKTVTGILGCSESTAVNNELKSHFSDIFVSHEAKANEISDSFVSVVQSNNVLKGACSAVI